MNALTSDPQTLGDMLERRSIGAGGQDRSLARVEVGPLQCGFEAEPVDGTRRCHGDAADLGIERVKDFRERGGELPQFAALPV